MLKAKRYYMKEWNEEIMPLVERGKLVPAGTKGVPLTKDEDNIAPIYRVFSAVVRDVATGKLYRATAWAPPGGKQYVEVEER